ncbi:calponin homology domain-containing protein DDB_G0272472-like [Clytia hemisphaerica]|uniref:FH2 domain-containing protein n=1 Tax=Clytia hemisphaerica TaxID=252671 RepID=A0A7M5UWI4_9CNID|eukprot:TCONS_00061429-protein
MRNLDEDSSEHKQQQRDRFSFVVNQFLNESHHSFHELLTSYSRMQCDFKDFIEVFEEPHTIEVVEEFFGAFAVFLQHFETQINNNYLTNTRETPRYTTRSRSNSRRFSLPSLIEREDITTNFATSVIGSNRPSDKFVTVQHLEVSTSDKDNQNETEAHNNHVENYTTAQFIEATTLNKQQNLNIGSGKTFKAKPSSSTTVRFKDTSEQRSQQKGNNNKNLLSEDSENNQLNSSVQIKTKNLRSGTTSDEIEQYTNRDSPHPKSIINEDIQEEKFVTIEFEEPNIQPETIDINQTIGEQSQKTFIPKSSTRASETDKGENLTKEQERTTVKFNENINQERHSSDSDSSSDSSSSTKTSKKKTKLTSKDHFSNTVKADLKRSFGDSSTQRSFGNTNSSSRTNEFSGSPKSRATISSSEALDTKTKKSPRITEDKMRDSPTSITDDARHAALQLSKSPQMVSRRLNNVKAKLNEETEKSKNVARRKITEHEEPLYFRVMKETFLEYEKQMELDENEDSNEEGKTGKKLEEQKCEFLNILQQKLTENVSENEQESFKDMKLSREKKVSVTEPVYSEVLKKTLEKYGKQKIERRRSLALGDDPKACPSPNLFVMFEENLVENEMMEKEEEENEDLVSPSSSDYEQSKLSPKTQKRQREDPVYMMVLKQALKQRRRSIHEKRKSMKKRTSNDLIIEEEIAEEDETEEHVSFVCATPSKIPLSDEESSSRKQNNYHKKLRHQPDSLQSSTNSTSSTGSAKSGTTNAHSRSSSDISLASEEVRDINRQTFVSACPHRFQHHQADILHSGTQKPALPVIPSPDYTVPDEAKDHPHHVARPFWSDDEEQAIEPRPSSAFTPTNEQKAEQVASSSNNYQNKEQKKRKVSNSSMKNEIIPEQEENVYEVVDPLEILNSHDDEPSDGDREHGTNQRPPSYGASTEQNKIQTPNETNNQNQESNPQSLTLSFNLITTTYPTNTDDSQVIVNAPPTIDRSRKPTKKRSHGRATPEVLPREPVVIEQVGQQNVQQFNQQNVQIVQHTQHNQQQLIQEKQQDPQQITLFEQQQQQQEQQQHKQENVQIIQQRNQNSGTPTIILSRSPSPTETVATLQQEGIHHSASPPPFKPNQAPIQMVPLPDYSPPSSPNLTPVNSRRRFMTPSPPQPIERKLIKVLDDSDSDGELTDVTVEHNESPDSTNALLVKENVKAVGQSPTLSNKDQQSHEGFSVQRATTMDETHHKEHQLESDHQKTKSIPMDEERFEKKSSTNGTNRSLNEVYTSETIQGEPEYAVPFDKKYNQPNNVNETGGSTPPTTKSAESASNAISYNGPPLPDRSKKPKKKLIN